MATSLTSPHFSLSLKNPVLSPLPAHSCLKFTRNSSSSSSHFRFGSTLGVTTNPPFSAVSSVRDTVDDLAAVVTADSWEESVVNSKVPVLVEFYASWCGPCKMVHQVMEEIAGEYAGKVKCFSLNTDNDPQVMRDYEIKAVPVVLIFKNGKKCESVVGTMPKEFYEAAIEKVLKL